MAELRATPMSNPILGLLADRLKKAQQFGAKPFGYENPPVEMLMNLLGVPAVQQTMERMAYGEPLTTGSGMTTKPRPESIEAAMTLLPASVGLAKATKGLPVGASIKNVGKFDVIKQDASEIFGQGSQRIRYIDPKSNGSIEVLSRPDGSASVLSLEVPKEFRGKKIGESLQKQVLEDFPDMQGQVSSKAAATTAYRLGRRPVDMPDATLKDVHKMIDEDSSVNMISPKMQKRISPSASYPQKEALDTAQRNAALPIEQGGLGLPKDNTPEMRAEAMGYKTPVYHGTNEDINIFNVEGKGKTSGAGAFFTTNPTAAETYVSASGGGNILPLLLRQEDFLTANAKGRNWADIYTNQLGAKAGKKRYSLEDLELDRDSATSTDELGIIASNLGLKGAEIKNVKDLGPNSHVMRAKEYLLDKYGIVPDETWSNVTGKQFDEARKYQDKFYASQKGDIYAIQDPSLVRSRFAAFDPMRKSEADILAGVLPLGLLADEEQRKKLYELMPSLLGQ